MNYHYEYAEEKIIDESIGEYTSYGISLIVNGEKQKTVSDVSVDINTVQRIVSLCNEYELEPIHMNDVIEDMICNDL